MVELTLSEKPLGLQRPRSYWKVITAAATALFVWLQCDFRSGIQSLAAFRTTEDDYAKLFLNALDINLALVWSEYYTSEAHLAGTNYPFVEWTKNKFEEYGLDATIDSYDILVSYPVDHSLKLSNVKDGLVYEPSLKEDVLKKDPTTGGDDLVPTFLGYAANGNVTGQYVYANYGTKEDFAHLKELGVDIQGKIVVVRYGKIFRGLKVKFAQDGGAIGVLLYTDPGDDYGITPKNGYKQYPDGPARQESSVQRGSVQFLGGENLTPGDPTTPGYPSKPGVPREDPYSSIGKIPALPISYREVKPILKALNGYGEKPKGDWAGELDGVKYYTGPNEDYTLNLFSNQTYNITELWNVYGEIKGEVQDEVIIIGNHRDAWIKGGAGDPNSGSAVLIELARAFGELKALGYKFKRSIILQSFDGEEYGLLGSTEQGEFYANGYKRTVVAYYNVDVAVSGKNLKLGSSPTLYNVLKDTAKLLKYPDSNHTLYDHFLEKKNGYISNLGSGSDYTVYLDHLGISSADIGFIPGEGDPIYHYHSNYDSFHWMETFADPEFVFHNLAAKYIGLVALKTSEEAVLPLTVTEYATALTGFFNKSILNAPKSWLDKVVTKTDSWKTFVTHDREDVKFLSEVASDYYSPKSRYPFPELVKGKTRMCPHSHSGYSLTNEESANLTFSDLIVKTKKELKLLTDKADIFDTESMELQAKWNDRYSIGWWEKLKLVYEIRYHNRNLKFFERAFLFHEGLDSRPWYKHIVFAPGRYTGYAGQTLPGLVEAIEDEDFERTIFWLGVVTKAFKRASDQLERRLPF